jgi:hypothetical protein
MISFDRIDDDLTTRKELRELLGIQSLKSSLPDQISTLAAPVTISLNPLNAIFNLYRARRYPYGYVSTNSIGGESILHIEVR